MNTHRSSALNIEGSRATETMQQVRTTTSSESAGVPLGRRPPMPRHMENWPRADGALAVALRQPLQRISST
jgi:hypothetical protein